MRASVIVPAYNSAGFIGACIAALKAQDFPKRDFEIIVVDDGSRDDTAKTARDAGARVISQPNGGPAKARNNGAKNAKGEMLVFTDADCVPEKHWLSEMLAPFSDHGVVGVQGSYRTKQESLIARFCQMEIEERYERMKRKSACLDWIGSYSAAYRRKDFFATGGFDESFPKASGEDPELSYKLAKAGKKLVFNHDAIVWHTHPDTLQKYLQTKYYRAFYRVNLYSKHMDKIASDSYTTQEIKVQIISFIGGTFFFFASLALAFFGLVQQAIGALAISTVFTIAGIASQMGFFVFAFRKDAAVALFSLIVVPLRTVVFGLGLLAGLVWMKVRK